MMSNIESETNEHNACVVLIAGEKALWFFHSNKSGIDENEGQTHIRTNVVNAHGFEVSNDHIFFFMETCDEIGIKHTFIFGGQGHVSWCWKNECDINIFCSQFRVRCAPTTPRYRRSKCCAVLSSPILLFMGQLESKMAVKWSDSILSFRCLFQGRSSHSEVCQKKGFSIHWISKTKCDKPDYHDM